MGRVGVAAATPAALTDWQLPDRSGGGQAATIRIRGRLGPPDRHDATAPHNTRAVGVVDGGGCAEERRDAPVGGEGERVVLFEGCGGCKGR